MDPNSPQMPIPPQTPPGPPMSFGMPGAMGEATDPSQQPVTQEERQVLLDLIQKIRDNLSNLKARDFAANGKLETIRRNLLHQVFDKMQMAGIDLNDRQSVSDFIENLRQQDPTLADQFEKAMEALLGAPPEPTDGADPNMNIQNETPPQTV